MKDKTKKNSGVIFPVVIELEKDIVCKGKAFLFSRIIKDNIKGDSKSVSFLVYL